MKMFRMTRLTAFITPSSQTERLLKNLLGGVFSGGIHLFPYLFQTHKGVLRFFQNPKVRGTSILDKNSGKDVLTSKCPNNYNNKTHFKYSVIYYKYIEILFQRDPTFWPNSIGGMLSFS